MRQDDRLLIIGAGEVLHHLDRLSDGDDLKLRFVTVGASENRDSPVAGSRADLRDSVRVQVAFVLVGLRGQRAASPAPPATRNARLERTSAALGIPRIARVSAKR